MFRFRLTDTLCPRSNLSATQAARLCSIYKPTVRRIAREQIGTNTEKLKTDSPRRHAADINIPLLMIHGDKNAQVRIDHSENMASALKRAKKSYKFVTIKDATHQMDRQSDRVKLLTEVEAFLKSNLYALNSYRRFIKLVTSNRANLLFRG
jgi:pimeloyl-ACP methyl ester carboxylesterase